MTLLALALAACAPADTAPEDTAPADTGAYTVEEELVGTCPDPAALVQTWSATELLPEFDLAELPYEPTALVAAEAAEVPAWLSAEPRLAEVDWGAERLLVASAIGFGCSASSQGAVWEVDGHPHLDATFAALDYDCDAEWPLVEVFRVAYAGADATVCARVHQPR